MRNIKKMKKKEVKGKNIEELQKILGDKREALKSFRLGNSGSKSKNIREAREIRRSIARILTAIKEIA